MADDPNSSNAAASPAAALLGREVIEIDREAGVVRLRYRARPEFANRHGTVQGGMLAAMLDSATGVALVAQLPPDQTAVTTRLDTSFVRPAAVGPIHAVAWIEAQHDTELTVRAELKGPDDVLVATAVATLRVIPRQR